MAQTKLSEFLLDSEMKAILTLLNITGRPIRGRQMFTLQMFVVVKEMAGDLDPLFQFYPYQYGPYSTVLANRVNRLLDAGLMTAQKIKGVWEYGITKKGQDRLDDYYMDGGYDLWEAQPLEDEEVESRLADMRDISEAWGHQHFRENLRGKYPEYFVRARY